MPTPSYPCVVLVPSSKVYRGFKEALAELNRRGYPVRRVRQEVAPPGFRDRMATDALAAGFTELLWFDPAIAFHPSDVTRLRAHHSPFAVGDCWPRSSRRVRSRSTASSRFALRVTVIRYK